MHGQCTSNPTYSPICSIRPRYGILITRALTRTYYWNTTEHYFLFRNTSLGKQHTSPRITSNSTHITATLQHRGISRINIHTTRRRFHETWAMRYIYSSNSKRRFHETWLHFYFSNKQETFSRDLAIHLFFKQQETFSRDLATLLFFK